MAVVINGTTGISGVDGSAGTPALQGSDPDTGIFYGTNTVSISTNGSTAVTVDANGDTTIANDLIVNGTTTQTGSTTFTAQTLFPDGTVSAPSISNTGDVNTGVYFPAADNVAIATGGVAALTADSSQNVSVTNTLVMGSSFKRNRLINGNFAVDQRNAGASLTISAGSTAYTVDRWIMAYAVGGSVIVQRVAGPNTYDYALQIQPQTGNTQTNVEQRIEYINAQDLSGKSVTVSGQVYVDSTSSGSAQLYYYYYPTNGGTQTFVSLGAVTLTAGQYVSFNKTFTCPTLYPSTASNVNSTGLGILLEMDNAAGRTFKWTNIQVEVGSVATPYERQIYSEQLAQCQRYYQAVNNIVFFSPSPSSSQIYMATALTFGQVMRATPVITYKSPNNGTANSLEQWGGTDRTVSSSVASSTGLQFAVLASGITTDVILQSNCTFTSEL